MGGSDGWGMGMTRRNALLGGIAALALAGCGGGPPPVTYDLTAVRQGLRRSGGGRTIIVPEPTAIFALDSERIVVRTAKDEITYLPRSQWSDKLPRLVQARLIQSFENAGRAAVGRPTDRLAGTAQLVIDIRSFEVREGQRDAFVEVAAKLVTSASGRLSNARIFGATAAVGAIDGQGASDALDQALGSVIRQIVAWAG
ncbi:MAG: ABC-type transport auxiliary lipoprotein family protein [Beijerinckiaceae bacterium]